MKHFIIAFEAVFPFFFYIAFGFLAVRLKWTKEEFMKGLNQLVFKAFFPFMMFNNFYSQRGKLNFNGSYIGFCIVSVLILLAVLWVTVPKIVREPPRTGVVIQAIYRTNTVLFAIPLMENLYGSEGTLLATTVVAVIVPLYNVAAVIILEYFRGGKVRISDLLKKIATNPLIMGAAAGCLVLLLKIELPNALAKPISEFAAMSTPLALFVLGASLKVTSMKKNRKVIAGVVLVKMVLLPAVTVAVSLFAGMSPIERGVYLVMFAAPVAASSYPMAQNMGGDGDLAGEIVVATTAVSVFTIFCWIFFLTMAGLM